MTFQNPWALKRPAITPESEARALAHVATGGVDGVATPGALKVTPRAVPGQGVAIGSGSAAVVARGAGLEGQSYTIRNAGPEDAPTTATGSQAGRTDLVVAVVKDSQVPGGSQWDEPADPVNGPYVGVVVVTNVPAGARKIQQVPGYEGWSAITLARLTIPAGTATITAAMITDLRQLSKPRQERVLRPMTATGGTLEQTTDHQWIEQILELPIPEWATHMVGQIYLDGLIQQFGGVNTIHRIRMGGTNNSGDTAIDTDALSTDAQRVDGRLVFDFAVPASGRGTVQQLRVLSRRVGSGAGRLRTGAATRIVWDFQFDERIA